MTATLVRLSESARWKKHVKLGGVERISHFQLVFLDLRFALEPVEQYHD